MYSKYIIISLLLFLYGCDSSMSQKELRLACTKYQYGSSFEKISILNNLGVYSSYDGHIDDVKTLIDGHFDRGDLTGTILQDFNKTISRCASTRMSNLDFNKPIDRCIDVIDAQFPCP